MLEVRGDRVSFESDSSGLHEYQYQNGNIARNVTVAQHRYHQHVMRTHHEH